MTVRYRLLSSLRVGGAGRPRDFPGGRPRLAGQVSTPDGVSAARGGVRRVLSFRWRWAPVQDSRGPGIRSPVRSDYRCPRKPGSLTMWGMSIGTSATAGPPVGGGTLGQDATTVYALVAARGRAPGCYARPRNWPPAARHCWTGWACGPGRLMGSYVWGDGGTAPVSDARAGTADRGACRSRTSGAGPRGRLGVTGRSHGAWACPAQLLLCVFGSAARRGAGRRR